MFAISSSKAFEKRNVYPVTMERGGMEEVMFISANPKFKSVNVYDAEMKTVRTKDLQVNRQQDMNKGKAQEVKKRNR